MNIKQNTTTLEAILEQVNSLPEAGMLITNSTQITCCIDTDSAEGWVEIIDESYVNEERYPRE